MQTMKKYDIFISYRRTAFETANLIATRLKAAGYSVFFDVEAMRSGKFNEQLYHVIDHCKDFVLVLSPNALDRCENEDDWVRLETSRAMQGRKNIIPVMLNGFSWPSPMPKGMEELCHYQALTASSHEYFDLAMQRLWQHYLMSKPHLFTRKVLKATGLTLLSLVTIFGLLWGIAILLSKGTCTKYATIVTQETACIHALAETSHDLQRDWRSFEEQLKSTHDSTRIADLKEYALKRIALAQRDVRKAWLIDSTALSINAHEAFLLSLHGINPEETAVAPQLATLYYQEFMGSLDFFSYAVKNPTTIHLRYVNALFEYYEFSFNAYYAAALSELSNYPLSSLRTFNEMSRTWTYFPTHYKTGEEASYYEKIITTENKRAEEVIAHFGGQLEQMDAELEDLERKSERLEEQANALGLAQ